MTLFKSLYNALNNQTFQIIAKPSETSQIKYNAICKFTLKRINPQEELWGIYECHHHYDSGYTYDEIMTFRKKEYMVTQLNELKFLKIGNYKPYNEIILKWLKNAKAKKFKRIGLKLLEATAPHLGNPRFMDFEEV
jgi:hypothetical protein